MTGLRPTGRPSGFEAATRPGSFAAAGGDGVLCPVILPQGITRTRWTRGSPDAHSSQLAPWSLER